MSNPVAIRHMWRQEVFPEAVLQWKNLLNCCFVAYLYKLLRQEGLCRPFCGDKEHFSWTTLAFTVLFELPSFVELNWETAIGLLSFGYLKQPTSFYPELSFYCLFSFRDCNFENVFEEGWSAFFPFLESIRSISGPQPGLRKTLQCGTPY